MKEEQLAMALLKMMLCACEKEGLTCLVMFSLYQKALMIFYSSFLPLNFSSYRLLKDWFRFTKQATICWGVPLFMMDQLLDKYKYQMLARRSKTLCFLKYFSRRLLKMYSFGSKRKPCTNSPQRCGQPCMPTLQINSIRHRKMAYYHSMPQIRVFVWAQRYALAALRNYVLIIFKNLTNPILQTFFHPKNTLTSLAIHPFSNKPCCLWPSFRLADNNRMSTQINWYIQFDNKTFTFLNKPKYDKYIFKAAELFVNAAVCEPSENIVVSQWVGVLSNAVRDISQLMYNFFYVEEKLADQEIIKVAFYQIHTVLKVENLYSNFFYIASENFRISRILACMIRLNRFLQALFEHIVNIKKNLDSTFLQNLDEVYIFIQQKLKQTLSKTQVLGNHDINIILLDTLSLILRNFGDTTMHKILDKTKVGHIIEMIEKENQVYQEYEQFKQKDMEEFKEHYEFIRVQLEPEEDPRIKQREFVEVEEDD